MDYNSFASGSFITIKEENMKYLYNLCVVDNMGNVLLDTKIVAKNREEALFTADVASVIKEFNITYDDVTIICFLLGNVPSK